MLQIEIYQTRRKLTVHSAPITSRKSKISPTVKHFEQFGYTSSDGLCVLLGATIRLHNLS